MKNKLVFLAALAAIIVLVTGCASGAAVYFENNGAFGEHIRTPVKDFETKGLVFVEMQFVTTSKTIEGEIFTYQALLKEAQKLGADAIINIVIDKKYEVATQGLSSNQQETWYGSALAIKYTTTLKSSETTTTRDDNTTTTTSSEQIYFNGGGGTSRNAGGTAVESKGLFGGLLKR